MHGSAEAETYRRCILYAIESASDDVAGYVRHALASLREHAERIVVIVPRGMGDDALATLAGLSDEVVRTEDDTFSSASYAQALGAISRARDSFDEIVLTGDGWFGPVSELGPVLKRMQDVDCHFWQMSPLAPHAPEAFPEEGFPDLTTPWLWTAVRPELFGAAVWVAYWEQAPQCADAERERRFAAYFAERGYVRAHAFPPASLPHADPAIFAPDTLIAEGCPLVARTSFRLYPPYLDRHAVIGRRTAASIEGTGFRMSLVWEGLVRVVPPKTLNANAGMLEVLPSSPVADTTARPLSIVAIAHISDVSSAEDVLDHLEHLPTGYDLVLTTLNGMDATWLQRLVESRASERLRQLEVRVTPTGHGRDMSDFFVGCRDVILGGEYDLVVKVHARKAPFKTVNALRYFRRYQLDNLLDSEGYVERVVNLFRREPGLGVVFPPMVHIGYATMGRAWAGLRDRAQVLCTDLGITVPLDVSSPLAPFGGMWIARPEALRQLSQRRWSYRDYERGRGSERLAHLQERLIPAAAAQRGYHCRTILTAEHASISHSALEYKVDQLFSTTRGWPVEQIRLLHRAGWTGYGGVVALSRMYLRVNHPRVAQIMAPAYRVGLRVFPLVSAGRRVAGRVARKAGVRR